jgi:hypothetical protein
MIHAAKVQIYSWLDKLYQSGKSAEPFYLTKKFTGQKYLTTYSKELADILNYGRRKAG